MLFRSENPMSGFPTLENPTQQNTNKQNTKRQSTNLSGLTDESADFDQMEAQVREEFRERQERPQQAIHRPDNRSR